MKGGLFLRILSIETRKNMSYRADFWIDALASFVVEITVAYFLWQAIFAESGREIIGGFGFEGMVFYYVMVLLTGKIVRGDARKAEIARDIYEGTLTRYLVLPGSYVAFKYAERLGNLFPALVQVLGFGGLAAWLLDVRAVGTITPGSTARAAAALVVGSLTAFLMSYLIESVAFWADNVWSLNVMLRFVAGLAGGQLLPLALFPGWAQTLVELLPFRFLFSFPVLTLIGRIEPAEWLLGMGVGLFWIGALYLAASLAWRRGYEAYTGVGI